jgi:hypothetical protein
MLPAFLSPFSAFIEKSTLVISSTFTFVLEIRRYILLIGYFLPISTGHLHPAVSPFFPPYLPFPSTPGKTLSNDVGHALLGKSVAHLPFSSRLGFWYRCFTASDSEPSLLV